MKTAIVTGCTGDIGKATTELYLEKGYRVYGMGQDKIKVQSLTERYPEHFEFIGANLSNQDGIETAKQAIATITAIDVLINCAGINIIKPLENTTFDDFNRLLSINLKACHFLSQACTPKMTSQQYGRIVNISSIWGVISKEQRSLYSMSKSGLNGLTRALAAEMGHHNILVNSISPGFIDTQLTSASLSDAQKADLISKVPMKRLGHTQEIAELIYFFGSEHNSFVTGQNIIADGGFSIV